MATTHTERTPGGQEITISTENPFPVRLDFEGVHMISTFGDNAVEMSIQDAREIHAALGKALKAHDKQQHDEQSRADWVRLFGNGKPN